MGLVWITQTGENMNTFQEAKKIINNSDFKVKNLETFRGHDGVGVNADIYHGKNRIAFIHDDAYGGELEITYLNFDNKKNEYDNYVAFKGDDKSENFVRDFLLNLPKYSWKDCLKDSGCSFEKEDSKKNKKWDDEHLFNEIINTSIQKREFKKLMRKVVMLKNNDEIVSFNIKSSDIDKTFRIEGKIQTSREYSNNKGYICLNSLAENEAFEIYLNHK